jgi:hypothetical protein
MVFNLNIVDLTIAVTSWNKSYLYIYIYIYIYIYCSIKLSTIQLNIKCIRQELQFSWFFECAIKLSKILSKIKLRLQYE